MQKALGQGLCLTWGSTRAFTIQHVHAARSTCAQLYGIGLSEWTCCISDFQWWWTTNFSSLLITRQLSYHKEDRAMRPIYGCPEKFWESSLHTRLLFRKFVIDFVPIDTKNVRTKFEVRSFTRSW